MLYGLMDCNNFFVSCERAFRPDLEGRPVVVLSNNDGCVVSRSNEAKAMQIPMGLPYFRLKEYDPMGLVTAFSSNYVLYADMSQRVMSILRDTMGDVEPYSIDESFFLPSMPLKETMALAAALPAKVRKCTGIPVSIGLAPTKTLAKVACRFAKKHSGYKGFCAIDSEAKREKAASLIKLEDVWGIGRKTLQRLNKAGYRTALDFCRADESLVRSMLGINGVRTWRELRGESSVMSDEAESKKSICTSRSFAEMVQDIDGLRSMIANFASMCAAKLRKQGSVANIVSVFVASNSFRDDLAQYSNMISVTLPVAASSQMEIVLAAERGLKAIFRPGYLYKRAGVVLSGIAPDHAVQMSLFHQNDGARRSKMEALANVVDRINKTEGINTLHLASQMTQKMPDKEGGANQNVFLTNLRRDHVSPRYSTDWDEIINVH